ncbi:cation-translocating P-type ATPase [Dyadobacter psychrophilus]|uniref:Ca2+-transporting ATPase n=1 Tax=Dyadobacter psychrophilus TaxID=651661 RepID=A0A1T5B8F3_9BACT|nr:cation-translocating P-type ATPase [Dyadobacter psychrophilus]SKB43329.1 Ca2+-transporting ATPase [Dyadobacter psychrophilus]
MQTENTIESPGLNDAQVLASRDRFGRNCLKEKSRSEFFEALISLVKEPMLILLMIAASIYFLTGSVQEGLMMVGAIVLISIISLYQDTKSRSALEKLRQFTQPKSLVIRNGIESQIPVEDIVVGDLLILEEGVRIASDGTVKKAHDFSVDESILTGESLSVFRYVSQPVYQGTLVASGRAVCKVTAIGNKTRLAQIGESLDSIEVGKTPLQIQINQLVRNMAFIGAVVFVFVWAINYGRSQNVLDSLMKALTLAMSILPEEIPVAFTTFMALGAFRLMKRGVIVKDAKTIEALGSASVVCTDKTGTITENRMSLAGIYLPTENAIVSIADKPGKETIHLLSTAMWASEPEPFDPMEIALHQAYQELPGKDERDDFQMVHEYPLSGLPPMMTHIFENGAGIRIVAAKGAPEAISSVCRLSGEENRRVLNAVNEFTKKGYRVLGVGQSGFSRKQFPEQQQQIEFRFAGLVAFYDPPKKNIQSVLESFYRAGIQIKIITGDNAATTQNIASQIGFRGTENVLLGQSLIGEDDQDLRKTVTGTWIFARMFPEAKLRVINALKANGEIVAMIGDGVNDGPALKAANIGIAMGKKGSEIAKQASALILQNDDLSGMVDAIAAGRRIYTNLKKAIRYIISIHIPVILTIFVPLLLGWKYAQIFTPVHVIFFELIMGPTCSIVYENEPADKDVLSQPPRPFTSSLFSANELLLSFVQGLIITAGLFGVYWYGLNTGCSEAMTRSLVFISLISANFFLTLSNRSFHKSLFTTLKYKNTLIGWVLTISVSLCFLILFNPTLRTLFKLDAVNIAQALLCILVGFISVSWHEIYKYWKEDGTKDSY